MDDPEGWNLYDDYRGFKYIDDQSERGSECSEYSYFEDFVSYDIAKKKQGKTFRTVMTKEEYLPE